MTGTGTSSDPYIVSNWVEFLGVCNISATTYVKFADGGGRIDFNDINPEGFATRIDLKGHLDFNNWELVNMYSKATDCIFYLSVNPTIISNLKLLNFYYQASGSNTTVMLLNGVSGVNTITNSIFSGKIDGKDVVVSNRSTVEFNRCSFNLEVQRTGSLISGVYNNCKINVEIPNNLSTNTFALVSTATLNNTLITGHITSKASTSMLFNSAQGSNASVFLVSCDKTMTTNGGLSNLMLYNSDMITVSESYRPANFKGCTTEQLKDADYLRSLGFPIGVD